jgi:hypothetical protein
MRFRFNPFPYGWGIQFYPVNELYPVNSNSTLVRLIVRFRFVDEVVSKHSANHSGLFNTFGSIAFFRPKMLSHLGVDGFILCSVSIILLRTIS